MSINLEQLVKQKSWDTFQRNWQADFEVNLEQSRAGLVKGKFEED